MEKSGGTPEKFWSREEEGLNTLEFWYREENSNSPREGRMKTREILVLGEGRVELSWRREEEDEDNSGVGRRKG